MSNFTLFPRLNDNLKTKIKFNTNKNINFFFTYDNTKAPQEISLSNTEDSIIKFEDRNNKWLYPYNDLIYKKKVAFDTRDLFGGNGIAPNNARLGLAIKWESQNSMLRGIEKQFTFGVEDGVIERDIEISFKEKQLRNKVDLYIILYLDKKVDYLLRNERHLNNKEGTILGVLEKKTLNFVGDSSQFPAGTISDKDEPLWYLEFYDNFDFENKVENSFKLIINEGHKKFALLNLDDKFDKDFFEEVSISIVFQLVLRAKEINDEFVDDENYYENDTVGRLVKYYATSFNLDFKNQTNEELYKNISRGLR